MSIGLEKRRLEIEEDPSESKSARFSRLEEEYRSSAAWPCDFDNKVRTSDFGRARPLLPRRPSDR